MTAEAWRIVKTKHAAQAFDGEGARLYGGRWNSPGHRVVYSSSTVSLAVLEILVHLETSIALPAYSLFSIQLDESLILRFSVDALPKDWRDSPAPPGLQTVRSRDRGRSWPDACAAWHLSRC